MIPGVAAASYHVPGQEFVTISCGTSTGRIALGNAYDNKFIAISDNNGDIYYATGGVFSSWSTAVASLYYRDICYVNVANNNVIVSHTNPTNTTNYLSLIDTNSWTVSQSASPISAGGQVMWWPVPSKYIYVNGTAAHAWSSSPSSGYTSATTPMKIGANDKSPYCAVTDGTTLAYAGQDGAISISTSTTATLTSLTWTIKTTGLSEGDHILCGAYGGNTGNKYWVFATKTGKIIYTTNHSSYTIVAPPAPTTSQILDIKFANGRWWAIAGAGDTNALYVSANENPSSTWTNTNIISGTLKKTANIGYSNGLIMIGHTNEDVIITL